MSSNTAVYGRMYAQKNRDKILRRRKERYWTDPLYRESMLEKTRKRRDKDKSERPRVSVSCLSKEDSRLIVQGEKNIRAFNKAAFARVVGVTRQTIDNWHRDGVLPVPKDVDDFGRYWYREDYVTRVDKCLGKYKLKLRKEVLAERIRMSFSG